MDYGRLVGEAWGTTWRNRYLWGLALFAGGAVGVGRGGLGWDNDRDMDERVVNNVWGRAGEAVKSNGAFDWSEAGPFRALRQGDWRFEDASAQAQTMVQGAAAWAVANAGLIVLLAALFAALAVGLVALGLIARGGMAEATVELASGRSSSFGRMWRAGTRLAWRYAGLWLILAAVALSLAAVVGGSVAAGIGAAAATGMPRMVWGIGALVAIPFALAAAVAGIALSVTVAYAERAIYAEDTGPIEALKSGWRVLRANVAASALLWLLNVGLAIGVGILTVLGGMALVGVIGSAGAAIWFTTGWSAGLVAFGVMGVGAVVVAVGFACAVVNSFFWNYWSLAYVRLTTASLGDAVP